MVMHQWWVKLIAFRRRANEVARMGLVQGFTAFKDLRIVKEWSGAGEIKDCKPCKGMRLNIFLNGKS